MGTENQSLSVCISHSSWCLLLREDTGASERGFSGEHENRHKHIPNRTEPFQHGRGRINVGNECGSCFPAPGWHHVYLPDPHDLCSNHLDIPANNAHRAGDHYQVTGEMR